MYLTPENRLQVTRCPLRKSAFRTNLLTTPNRPLLPPPEGTLGTELQGTPEPPELAGMIPKPVRRSFILPVGIFRPGGRCQTG